MLEGNFHTSGDSHRIAVIGAGPAGIAAAVSAAVMGMRVDWYSKDNRPGGKLNDYYELFPDRISADQVMSDYEGLMATADITPHFGTPIDQVNFENRQYVLYSDKQVVGYTDSLIIATGFDFFDARIKEEFGYGLYKKVITSPDLEHILKTNPETLLIHGSDPSAMAFVHCVGSRDQQVGNNYCSRLCCVTGIKQAIEIRERFPSCKVVNFYIDIRTFGNGYEELYREAQEKHHVRFIRGRVSEASENQDHRIILKAEDTLLARPLKFTADWLVLLVGMVPACSRVQLEKDQSVNKDTGFYQPEDPFGGSGLNGYPGVFTAGACSGPMSIPEAAASGRSAAMEAWHFLKNR